MTALLCALYFCTGSLLLCLNADRIWFDIPDPSSITSVVQTGLKWALTWPLWVFRRA